MRQKKKKRVFDTCTLFQVKSSSGPILPTPPRPHPSDLAFTETSIPMLVVQLCHTTSRQMVKWSALFHLTSPTEDMPDQSGNQAGRTFQRFAEDGADRGW